MKLNPTALGNNLCSLLSLRPQGKHLFPLSMALYIAACGSGTPPPPPPPPASVTISGPSGTLNVGTSFTFSAMVHNSTNQDVTWSVEEPSGGTITQGGQYTAPSLPGTFHVKALSLADSSAFAATPVPVVIPVGHIPGYDVGVDYHATGTDFLHTTFMTTYQQAS